MKTGYFKVRANDHGWALVFQYGSYIHECNVLGIYDTEEIAKAAIWTFTMTVDLSEANEPKQD